MNLNYENTHNIKKKKKNQVYVLNVSVCLFFFFLVTIAFKPMASAYDGCSSHQAKTPIDFWCRQDLNLGSLLDDKKLYQLS